MPEAATGLLPERYRILTVDDDPAELSLAVQALEEAGFEVWTAASAQEALDLLDRRGLPHLALVDIVMPGMNGIALGAKIQEFIDLPIIMLTAVDRKETLVLALREVAEDYITKPFDSDELTVRVENLLKRIGDFSYALEPRIRIDERLEVELARRLAIVDGHEVELTPTETKLLYILMRNAGHTVQSGFLLQRLWPMEEIFEDTLRTHVYRLRKKIEASPRQPQYVITKRGMGYSFPSVPS